MASESILGLLFEIGADPSKAILATGEFRDKASAALHEFEEKLMETMTHSLGITKEFAVGMGVAGGAVAGLGIAMFELADKAAEAGGKIFEASEKTSLSASSLSAISAISKETGESFDGLTVALGRATINITKAMQAGDAHKNVLRDVMGGAQALSELGLKPMDERFQEVLHRIFEMNDAGERNQALSALLGRGWQGNFSTLQLLAEQGYAPAIAKAKEFGMYFDDNAARKAREFELQWKNMKATLEAYALAVGQTLIPAMSATLRNIMVEIEYVKQYGIVFQLVARGNLAAASMAAVQIFEHGKTLGKIMNEVEKEMGSLTAAASHAIGTEGGEAGGGTGLHGVKGAAGHAGENLKKVKTAAEELADRLAKIYDKATPLAGILERITAAAHENAKAMHEVATIMMPIPQEFDALSSAMKKAEAAQMPLRGGFEVKIPAAIHVSNDAIRQHMALLKNMGSSAIDVFSTISGAMTKHHVAEVAITLARAALKSAEQIAEALAAAAWGDFRGATMHYAAAAAYAAEGSLSAFTGGGSSYSAPASAASSVTATAPSPTASAGGGAAPGGNMHVMIMGDSQQAQYLAGVIDRGVKYQGVQLTASHSLRPVASGA